MGPPPMATDTPRALLWPFAALLAVGACDRVEGERPTPLAQNGAGAMQGGAAEVDITMCPQVANIRGIVICRHPTSSACCGVQLTRKA